MPSWLSGTIKPRQPEKLCPSGHTKQQSAHVELSVGNRTELWPRADTPFVPKISVKKGKFRSKERRPRGKTRGPIAFCVDGGSVAGGDRPAQIEVVVQAGADDRTPEVERATLGEASQRTRKRRR